MPYQRGTPEHGELVRDLKVLREKGLLRLRSLDLQALQAAAEAVGEAAYPGGYDPPAIENLLRKAVETLGGDEMGEAAEYLFGLVQGTVGWKPTDLRQRAASIYHLSPESFRKQPEQLLIARVADEILRLCARAPLPAALPRQSPPDPAAVELGRHGPFALPIGAGTVPFLLHVGPVELLAGIDVVVSSENTHLEMAKPFKGSFSGALRSAAARRDASGGIVDDVLARELAAWCREHGRPGLPVAPGTVVPTSSGALAVRGIRRIYHAAVVSPREGTNEYDVDGQAILRAVRNALALARQERGAFDPPLRSVCLPLFGAGRGGIDSTLSFAWIWAALQEELGADNSWEIHISTLRPDQAAMVLRKLLHEAGH